jgi:glycosyltransferase involved in cell wall biosynthesis
MWEPHLGPKVAAWPVGIDTDLWVPSGASKRFDFILYDKVRWHHDAFARSLLQPISDLLATRGLTYQVIRYGNYVEEDFRRSLAFCRAMIFLCEHETQGLAYQQALSAGVPVLAWDRGGYWRDPTFYPHKVKFGPVSSVPYWDQRCGAKFTDTAEFPRRLDEFLARRQEFDPRAYILENLTLETCAQRYLDFVAEAEASA